jgi:FkbM family methyltransferase
VKQLLKRILIRLHLEFPFRLYRLYWRLRKIVPTIYWRLLFRLNIEIDRDIRYDLETIDVMRRILRKDSNCVDVGCYKGAILQEILKLSPMGVHYAFEPIPELCQALKSRFPNVKISRAALSDTKGEMLFYDVVSSRAHSGLKSRNLEQTEEVHEITVPTDLLDNLIPSDMPIHFIKIDVEGAELLVLRGAVNTIRRNKPFIVFEHGLGGADYYNAFPQGIYDLLVKECGLHISLIKNWLGHAPPLSQKEFVNQFDQHKNYYFIAHP